MENIYRHTAKEHDAIIEVVASAMEKLGITITDPYDSYVPLRNQYDVDHVPLGEPVAVVAENEATLGLKQPNVARSDITPELITLLESLIPGCALDAYTIQRAMDRMLHRSRRSLSRVPYVSPELAPIGDITRNIAP
ncbi:hypothetical protein [Parasphingorhabdus flavimaris]|uniref:hypothetical protein n=1 Tax=Parasphingorhabdus flavimaris TaxID=266812 RepID=UPI003002409F